MKKEQTVVHDTIWLREPEEAHSSSDEGDYSKQLPFTTRKAQSTGRELFLRMWRGALRRCGAPFVRIPMLLGTVLEGV